MGRTFFKIIHKRLDRRNNHHLKNDLRQEHDEMNYLSKELAEEIVERTMSIIRHNINMMDENGVIIAS